MLYMYDVNLHKNILKEENFCIFDTLSKHNLEAAKKILTKKTITRNHTKTQLRSCKFFFHILI